MISILLYSIIFFVTFYNLGLFINQRFNFDLDSWLFFPFGLITWLGIIQFLIYPIVWLKIPTIVFFGLLLILVIVINVKALLSKRKNKLNKYDIGFYLCMLIFVAIMVYFSSNRTLGQNSFDTNFYLSIVIQGSTSPNFSFVEYGTGFVSNVINTQYDYQSFYAFGSFILATLEPIVHILNSSYFTITTHTFIWTISILFYMFEFTLLIGMIKQFNLKLNPIVPFIILLFLGYHSLVYYNSIFAFFGNTYRVWILAFLMMEIYRSITTQIYRPFILLLASSALIAVSSTGFFLGIIVLTPYVMFIFMQRLDFNRTIEIVSLLIFPTLVFALFYLGSNQINIFMIILVLIILLYGLFTFLYFSKMLIKDKIYSLIRILIVYGIPIIILGYSIYASITGMKLPQSFFFDHRAYDMVWYYFNTESSVNILINAFYFISLIIYVLMVKNKYRWCIISLIILFINPISSQFVVRFLASVVYYRSFEVIFNPFTVLILSTSALSLINYKQVKYIISILLFLYFTPKVIEHSSLYYHSSFLPNKEYSSLYRVNSSEIEVLSVLKTKIILENYKNAKVISQIEMVRGFVPNVITPISNETIRSINRYAINKERSKLLTIFMNRDFIGQEIFDVKPEYDKTCQYLMDERIDFVIVDKNQFYYDEEGLIIPLYFKVRDCATPIYESNDYFIYQFYW